MKNFLLKNIVKLPFYRYLYLLVVRSKIRFLERKNYFDNFDIENTNVCNANCLMCPINSMTRKKGIMNMKLFLSILDRIKREKIIINTMHLSGFGEPLVDKNIIKKIKYAKKLSGVKKVKIFSNISLLDKNKARDLVVSGLDEINISFNGFSSKTIKKTMNLNFHKMRKNIHYLIEEKDRQATDKPNIIISFVVFNENKRDVALFKNYWSKYPVTAIVHDEMDYPDPIKNKNIYKKTKYYPCPKLWNSFQVTWDGKIKACSRDFDASIQLGSIVSETLKKIFNGDKFTTIKRAHLQGDLDKYQLCKNCELMQHKGSYIWWKI